MKQILIALIGATLTTSAFGQGDRDRIQGIVDTHILPGFETLAIRSEDLARISSFYCSASSTSLRSAYAAAFDAWLAVSHLNFGPAARDDRAYALAFWPDTRGATPKVLRDLIRKNDPIALSPEDYTDVSIAARGFYALEFLIYDRELSMAGDDEYRCKLVQTIAEDIENLAASIHADWQNDYAKLLLSTSNEGLYRSHSEALQQLFKALTTGLQFTSEARLGRPLGTFERPRPKRAEAWRSGRSGRHVLISLAGLRDIAILLAPEGSVLEKRLGSAFEHALSQLAAVDDPVFSGVAAPQTRIKIEIVQQSVEAIRSLVRDELGPELGVSAGFNAMDGD